MEKKAKAKSLRKAQAKEASSSDDSDLCEDSKHATAHLPSDNDDGVAISHLANKVKRTAIQTKSLISLKELMCWWRMTHIE